MRDRGYAVMERLKTGERWFTSYTSRETAERVAVATLSSRPTANLSVIEWSTVKAKHAIADAILKARGVE